MINTRAYLFLVLHVLVGTPHSKVLLEVYVAHNTTSDTTKNSLFKFGPVEETSAGHPRVITEEENALLV